MARGNVDLESVARFRALEFFAGHPLAAFCRLPARAPAPLACQPDVAAESVPPFWLEPFFCVSPMGRTKCCYVAILEKRGRVWRRWTSIPITPSPITAKVAGSGTWATRNPEPAL